MPASVWAILLFVIAIAIVVLEMFIPSGGLLAIMAVTSLLGSIIVVFKHYGILWGTAYLVFNAVMTPFLIMTALRWWPHTPIGRKMLNLPPGEKDEITSIPSFEKYTQLVGKVGTAQSKMLPSGTIKIGDRTHDAVSQGMAIDPGQAVLVVAVEGNRIIVRPTFDDEAQSRPTAESTSQPTAESQVKSNTELGTVTEPESSPSDALDQAFPDPFAVSDSDSDSDSVEGNNS